MSPLMEQWVKKATLAVYEGLSKRESLSAIKARLRLALPKVDYLNAREKNALVEAGMGLARRNRLVPPEELPAVLSSPGQQHQMDLAANAMDRHLQLKAKNYLIASSIERGRKTADPQIFFMVSTHQKPAEMHRAIQGTLLVDRYWRQTLRDRGMEDLIPEVESYIIGHGIPTVQWAVGKPLYLITRPYCRHRLIPVGVGEALALKDFKAIGEAHPEKLDHAHRSMTDSQRYAKYQARRKAERQAMDEKAHRAKA